MNSLQLFSCTVLHTTAEGLRQKKEWGHRPKIVGA